MMEDSLLLALFHHHELLMCNYFMRHGLERHHFCAALLYSAVYHYKVHIIWIMSF